jgi:hypothetical protein
LDVHVKRKQGHLTLISVESQRVFSGRVRLLAMFRVGLDTQTKVDKSVTQECHLEPVWRHNEAILNKRYFQHKVPKRSNTSRLLQVSEEAEWKATLMKHC